jgi:peptide/nickel transport system permease protein
MGRYAIGRLVAGIPVVLGASLLVFGLLFLIPGDPVDALSNGLTLTADQRAGLRASLGLDQPFIVQYGRFLAGAVHGDLGRSLATGRPVALEIETSLPATVELAVASLAIALGLGLGLGTLAALRQGSVWDTLCMIAALGGMSIPSIWLGLLLLMVFSLWLGWLPASGTDGVERLILPAVTLGYGAAAIIARLVRSALLEVLDQEYVRTASAKGLRQSSVVLRHALKNALIPVITLVGVQAGHLLAGAVIVETIFSRQGIGRLLVQALLNRDFPMVQGVVLFVATVYVVLNIGVDLAYGWIDPRIRYS